MGKYGKLTLGQVLAAINMLGGEEGVKLLLSGKLVVKPVGDWKIWKTILIGGNSIINPKDFLTLSQEVGMNKKGLEISSTAIDAIGCADFKPNIVDQEVDLVKIPAEVFGLPNNAPSSEVVPRAIKAGLELCPVDLGPKLRLGYDDQPVGEAILVGMHPISCSGQIGGFFTLVHDDHGLFLGFCQYSHNRLTPKYNFFWVFILPKKTN